MMSKKGTKRTSDYFFKPKDVVQDHESPPGGNNQKADVDDTHPSDQQDVNDNHMNEFPRFEPEKDVHNSAAVHECGASLVFNDEYIANESLSNKLGPFGGDFSRFQLSTGAYYLCRRDFFELMEVGRLTPGWLRNLVGDTIDDTEVRGWRKTGRPQLPNPSITELKTVRCIIHGPEMEDIYKIAERVKSSVRDKSGESRLDGETLKSITTPELSDVAKENAGKRKKDEIVFESPIREERDYPTNQLLQHDTDANTGGLECWEFDSASGESTRENVKSDPSPSPESP